MNNIRARFTQYFIKIYIDSCFNKYIRKIKNINFLLRHGGISTNVADDYIKANDDVSNGHLIFS